MEVNETIALVGLKGEYGLSSGEQQAQARWLAMLSDEGRQAQWPWGKFFQSGWELKVAFVCVNHA